jgi:hypothetical protein
MSWPQGQTPQSGTIQIYAMHSGRVHSKKANANTSISVSITFSLGVSIRVSIMLLLMLGPYPRGSEPSEPQEESPGPEYIPRTGLFPSAIPLFFKSSSFYDRTASSDRKLAGHYLPPAQASPLMGL